jgi:hypothetical protein
MNDRVDLTRVGPVIELPRRPAGKLVKRALLAPSIFRAETYPMA